MITGHIEDPDGDGEQEEIRQEEGHQGQSHWNMEKHMKINRRHEQENNVQEDDVSHDKKRTSQGKDHPSGKRPRCSLSVSPHSVPDIITLVEIHQIPFPLIARLIQNTTFCAFSLKTGTIAVKEANPFLLVLHPGGKRRCRRSRTLPIEKKSS